MASPQRISVALSGTRARRFRRQIKKKLPEYLSLNEVSEKLSQFEEDCAAELLDYIVILVCGGRHRDQMSEDLEPFMGQHSARFSTWLWDEHIATNLSSYFSRRANRTQPPPHTSPPDMGHPRAENANPPESRPSQSQTRPFTQEMQQPRAENAAVEGDFMDDAEGDHIGHTGGGEAERMDVETGGDDGTGEAQNMNVELPGGAALLEAPAADHKLCAADDCNENLTNGRYSSRYRFCSEHMKAKEIMYKGGVARVCWKCRRAHPLSDYEGEKKNCLACIPARPSRRSARELKRSLKNQVPGHLGQPKAHGGIK